MLLSVGLRDVLDHGHMQGWGVMGGHGATAHGRGKLTLKPPNPASLIRHQTPLLPAVHWSPYCKRIHIYLYMKYIYPYWI